MANVTGKPSEHLKRTEINIRKRVECEQKAFYIINKLIDGSVDGDYLSECGKLISQANYDDIVEERAISKLCGYPVCDQAIPNVPKKRYHISTKSNKVYDISERKNFCSNQCYKASKCFRQQIPESPVWTRKEEPIHIVVSPHKGMSGMVGEEVVGLHPKEILKQELERLKELDERTEERDVQQKFLSPNIHSVSEENKENFVLETGAVCNDKSSELVIKEHATNDLPKVSIVTENDVASVGKKLEEIHIKTPAHGNSVNHSSSSVVTGEKQNCDNVLSSQPSSKLEQLQKLLNKRKNILKGMVDLQETDSPSISTEATCVKKPTQSVLQKKKYSSSQSIPKEECTSMLSPLQLICNVMKKWVTISTIEYLEYKSVKVESNEHLGEITSEMSELAIDVGCDSLNQMLGNQQKEIASFLGAGNNVLNDADKEGNRPTKYVPHYKALQEESEQFQLKVKEFITGKKVKENNEKKAEDKDDIPVYIPTVDAFDQSQIRVKIVLEKLDKSLPDILIPMALAVQDVSTFIREIVYTFRLEKDTIIFKPAEWTLVSLVLLKMLSFRMKSINEAFLKGSSKHYFNVLLHGIKHTLDDLDQVTRDVLAEAAIDFKPYS